MARGDIYPRRPKDGTPEIVIKGVAAGTVASIKAGELVLASTNNNVVAVALSGTVNSSSAIYGVASSDSNETASVAGTVAIMKIDPSIPFTIKAANSYNANQMNQMQTITRDASGNFTLNNVASPSSGVAYADEYDATSNTFGVYFRTASLPN